MSPIRSISALLLAFPLLCGIRAAADGHTIIIACGLTAAADGAGRDPREAMEQYVHDLTAHCDSQIEELALRLPPDEARATSRTRSPR